MLYGLPFRTMALAALIATAMALPARGQAPELTATLVTETAAAAPGTTLRAVLQVSLTEGWHVNANKPLDPFLIPTAVTLDEGGVFSLAEAVYPEYKLFTVGTDELAVYEHEFNIGLILKVAEGVPPGEAPLTGTLRYQSCDDVQCMPPVNHALDFTIAVGDDAAAVDPELFASVTWPESTGGDSMVATGSDGEAPAQTETAEGAETGDWRELAERFTVTGRAGYEKTDAFLSFLGDSLSAEGAADQGKAFADMGWLLIIAIIIGGGLALNLTPCVLPLIPVNVAIIGAGTKAGSRGRGFALGGAFGAGIALVYGLLGLAVMLSFATAFGTINASPWFNGLIAALFVVLGLAMFDVIRIDFTRFQSRLGIRKNENGSFLIAFGMGSVSALLAGACVAPVVISTILFAQDSYSQGNTFALALPFLLGVGMALPWPFVGGGLSVLPKPGKWMVRVKQGFGVFILAFAAYYGYLAYSLLQVHTVSEDGHEGWHTTLESGLAEALETGQPVFLDFWATWCKNCSVMDATTLRDPAVVETLEDFVKIRYQAEHMDRSPAKEIVEYYDVLGLPAYLVLVPEE